MNKKNLCYWELKKLSMLPRLPPQKAFRILYNNTKGIHETDLIAMSKMDVMLVKSNQGNFIRFVNNGEYIWFSYEPSFYVGFNLLKIFTFISQLDEYVCLFGVKETELAYYVSHMFWLSCRSYKVTFTPYKGMYRIKSKEEYRISVIKAINNYILVKHGRKNAQNRNTC